METIMRYSQVDDVMKQIQFSNCSNDRLYTLNFIKSALMYLKNKNITQTPDFIQTFRKHGFKSKSIVDFIVLFVQYYNERHVKKNIIWFKQRSWRQANYVHKNFVLVRIILEYEQDFYNFIYHYFSINNDKTNDLDGFIKEISNKVAKISNKMCNVQAEKIDVSKCINIEEPNYFDYDRENEFGNIFDDEKYFFY